MEVITQLGKPLFSYYLLFILIHTIHPDKSLSSLYSSQQPPTTFSFPKSTAPLFPLRKKQTSQRYQASIAYQDPITVGINPYIKAGQDSPVERVQRDEKEPYIPFPMWGVAQIPQAKQPLHVCSGLHHISMQEAWRSCHFYFYELLWALFIDSVGHVLLVFSTHLVPPILPSLLCCCLCSSNVYLFVFISAFIHCWRKPLWWQLR